MAWRMVTWIRAFLDRPVRLGDDGDDDVVTELAINPTTRRSRKGCFYRLNPHMAPPHRAMPTATNGDESSSSSSPLPPYYTNNRNKRQQEKKKTSKVPRTLTEQDQDTLAQAWSQLEESSVHCLAAATSSSRLGQQQSANSDHRFRQARLLLRTILRIHDQEQGAWMPSVARRLVDLFAGRSDHNDDSSTLDQHPTKNSGNSGALVFVFLDETTLVEDKNGTSSSSSSSWTERDKQLVEKLSVTIQKMMLDSNRAAGGDGIVQGAASDSMVRPMPQNDEKIDANGASHTTTATPPASAPSSRPLSSSAATSRLSSLFIRKDARWKQACRLVEGLSMAFLLPSSSSSLHQKLGAATSSSDAAEPSTADTIFATTTATMTDKQRLQKSTMMILRLATAPHWVDSIQGLRDVERAAQQSTLIAMDTEWAVAASPNESSKSTKTVIATMQLAIRNHEEKELVANDEHSEFLTCWVLDLLKPEEDYQQKCKALACSLLCNKDKLVLGFSIGHDVPKINQWLFSSSSWSRLGIDGEPQDEPALVERSHILDLQKLWPQRQPPSLATCVREFSAVPLSKQQQRSDWSRRPLSEEQLAYAGLDAAVLLVLLAEKSRRLQEQLVKSNGEQH